MLQHIYGVMKVEKQGNERASLHQQEMEKMKEQFKKELEKQENEKTKKLGSVPLVIPNSKACSLFH